MLVAGTDETGVGCLAGPLMAVTVVMDVPIEDIKELKSWWPLDSVDDSKKLGEAKRERLRKELPNFIIEHCGEVGIGLSSVDLYNNRGHTYAWDRALGESVRKATKAIDLKPKLLIIDGNRHIDGYPWAQRAEPKADGNYFLVAAASVLAKIMRDDIMDDLHRLYPNYGWDDNKGYGTAHHTNALLKHGLTRYHRMVPCQTRLRKANEKSQSR